MRSMTWMELGLLALSANWIPLLLGFDRIGPFLGRLCGAILTCAPGKKERHAMNMAPDDAVAIPLWVNGRAFLTVTDSFFDVADPQTGKVLHCIPLCGPDEAGEAAGAARAALPAWSALDAARRQALLAALADALAGYAPHFAKLIGQETGFAEAAAAAEVAAAIAALRGAAPAGSGGVAAIVTDAGHPLAALAQVAAPLLAGGATVVCKPSPQASAAAFALCELSARAGWPAGVLNLLQGDKAAIEALCDAPAVDRMIYAGEAGLGDKIAAIAGQRGKALTRISA